jgi:hypothetical protein
MPLSRSLDNHADLGSDQLSAIRAATDTHEILEHVARWRSIVAVITQDEYTHDVIVQWDGNLHLVYDTT